MIDIIQSIYYFWLNHLPEYFSIGVLYWAVNIFFRDIKDDNSPFLYMMWVLAWPLFLIMLISSTIYKKLRREYN